MAALLLWTALGGGAVAEPYRFPGSDIVLRDGDILLSYFPSAINSFNRLFAVPRGPYAHALLYVESPDAAGRLIDYSAAGLKVLDPAMVLDRAYRYALVRPRLVLPPGELSRRVADMRRRDQAGELSFDFGFDWTLDDDGRYYCTEFISRLFRQAGAADPFPPVFAAENDYWMNWVSSRMEMDFSRIVSPNAPLYLGDFELIAEYRQPLAPAARREIILDTIFLRIQHFVREQGMEPGPPSAGSRLLLGLADAGFFARGLVGGLPPRSRAIMLAVNEFVIRVQDRVEEQIWLQEEEHWLPEKVVELTKLISDAYRDRHFVSPARRQ